MSEEQGQYYASVIVQTRFKLQTLDLYLKKELEHDGPINRPEIVLQYARAILREAQTLLQIEGPLKPRSPID